MNERGVLEQRVTTLDGLLVAGGVLGPAGTGLAERLRADWQAERRLLARLLAESPGDDVRATIDVWEARTRAFVDRTDGPAPGWTDREGSHWDAIQVLALLEATVERLDAWLAADEILIDPDDEAEA